MRENEFGKVLQEYAGLISRIAGSYEADPGLRDDLIQDIALALWKALPAWRGDAALRTLVARIAHNRGATHVVKAMRGPPVATLEEDPADIGLDPETHAQLLQKHRRLQNAVRALPLKFRPPVTLALEGFSHREIAEATGISENNVAVRLHRARKLLAKQLGEPE